MDEDSSSWRVIRVPVALRPEEAQKNRLQLLLRNISGALELWASRLHDFRSEDYPGTQAVAAYCASRIDGHRRAPRPSAQEILRCMHEAGDQIDLATVRALSLLAKAFKGQEDGGPQTPDSILGGLSLPPGLDGEESAQAVAAEVRPLVLSAVPIGAAVANAAQDLQRRLQQRRMERAQARDEAA